MSKADEYRESLAGLKADAYDLLLRLEHRLDAGPPTPEAVEIAGWLHDMRGPMAAAELRDATIAAIRESEYARGWQDREQAYAEEGRAARLRPLRAVAG